MYVYHYQLLKVSVKTEFQNDGQRNVQLVKCYSLQSLVRAKVGLIYSVLLQAEKVERSSHFSPVLFQSFHLRKQMNVKCRESPGVQNGSALDGGRIGWLGEWKRALKQLLRGWWKASQLIRQLDTSVYSLSPTYFCRGVTLCHFLYAAYSHFDLKTFYGNERHWF